MYIMNCIIRQMLMSSATDVELDYGV